MRNPLIRRIPRELRGEWHKYLVIFVFLALTIAFVSGMFVANESMLISANEGKDRYLLEDGNFELDEQADDQLLSAIKTGDKADVKAWAMEKALKKADKAAKKAATKAVKEQTKGMAIPDEQLTQMIDDAVSEAQKEAEKKARKAVEEKFEDEEDEEDEDFQAVPVKLYENFFREQDEDNDLDGKRDGKVRIFKLQKLIDQACVMDGRLPEKADEIAIDRMHADNVGLDVGDEIRVDQQKLKVTGLIALVNYSTLFEKNSDTMFDALDFDVALVTPECFEELNGRLRCSYAWKYEDTTITEDAKVEKERSEDLMKAVYTQAAVHENELLDFVPSYVNQAIHFATDDFGSDKTMGGYLLYILVAVLAFIFAITISSTITREASVIGTLRASGYTRGELLLHYMSAPVIVTLLAAVVGNVLGYTYFKGVVVGMYYNSYSLPTYETVWNTDAFVKTTVVPVILMLIINGWVIGKKLRLSPLRFLRHDLGRKGRKKAMRLPKFKFMGRFRLRIFFQNVPNYVMLLVGVCFVMIMMFFCVGVKASLTEYQEHAVDMMFAKHQIVLKHTQDEDGNEIRTANADAEKYSAQTLSVKNLIGNQEDVTVYGVQKDSDFIRLGHFEHQNGVYISSAFSQKLGVGKSDKIKLKAKYTDDQYEFTVDGVYDYPGSVSVFMLNSAFNRIFDLEEDSFNGYLTDQPIRDIDEKDILTSIGEEEITKVSRQLDHSIGSYMSYFQVVCVLLAAVLIYLLTKVVIEKNENAISMVKILGYEDREIASLYIVATTWVVVISEIIGIFAAWGLIKLIWLLFLQKMGGWIAFTVPLAKFAVVFAEVFVAYLLVMLVDFRRIHRVPMDQALKNVE